MQSRYVRPETDTIPISNGDTLTVRRRLNAGEQRIRRNMALVQTLEELAVVLAYLLDWTLKYDDGERIVIAGLPQKDVVAKLDGIDPESFDEIYRAIVKHEEAMRAERDQEKNALAGEKNASAISPLPSVAAGALSGSVN